LSSSRSSSPSTRPSSTSGRRPADAGVGWRKTTPAGPPNSMPSASGASRSGPARGTPSYTGGQRQRVAIARALAGRTAIHHDDAPRTSTRSPASPSWTLFGTLHRRRQDRVITHDPGHRRRMPPPHRDDSTAASSRHARLVPHRPRRGPGYRTPAPALIPGRLTPPDGLLTHHMLTPRRHAPADLLRLASSGHCAPANCRAALSRSDRHSGWRPSWLCRLSSLLAGGAARRDRRLGTNMPHRQPTARPTSVGSPPNPHAGPGDDRAASRESTAVQDTAYWGP